MKTRSAAVTHMLSLLYGSQNRRILLYLCRAIGSLPGYALWIHFTLHRVSRAVQNENLRFEMLEENQRTFPSMRNVPKKTERKFTVPPCSVQSSPSHLPRYRSPTHSDTPRHSTTHKGAESCRRVRGRGVGYAHCCCRNGSTIRTLPHARSPLALLVRCSGVCRGGALLKAWHMGLRQMPGHCGVLHCLQYVFPNPSIFLCDSLAGGLPRRRRGKNVVHEFGSSTAYCTAPETSNTSSSGHSSSGLSSSQRWEQ